VVFFAIAADGSHQRLDARRTDGHGVAVLTLAIRSGSTGEVQVRIDSASGHRTAAVSNTVSVTVR
jgi:hypothetical protein